MGENSVSATLDVCTLIAWLSVTIYHALVQACVGGSLMYVVCRILFSPCEAVSGMNIHSSTVTFSFEALNFARQLLVVSSKKQASMLLFNVVYELLNKC